MAAGDLGRRFTWVAGKIRRGSGPEETNDAPRTPENVDVNYEETRR